MKNHTLLPLILLVGCHQFEGELGQLGFVSSLILRPDVPWTPQHAVAAETPVEIAASAFLTHDTEEPPRVQATTDGTLIALDPVEGDIAFTGEAGDAGRVLFWGEATDRFSVRFSEPAAAVLLAPERDAPLDAFAVLAGAKVSLHAGIQDAWGQPLGHDPALLSASGCGAVVSEDGVLTLATAWDCTLTVALDGRPLLTEPIAVVSAEDIAEVLLTTEPIAINGEDALAVSVRAFSEAGDEILGLSPDWSVEPEALHAVVSDRLIVSAEDTPMVTLSIGTQTWEVEAGQLRQPETTSTSRAP